MHPFIHLVGNLFDYAALLSSKTKHISSSKLTRSDMTGRIVDSYTILTRCSRIPSADAYASKRGKVSVHCLPPNAAGHKVACHVWAATCCWFQHGASVFIVVNGNATGAIAAALSNSTNRHVVH